MTDIQSSNQELITPDIIIGADVLYDLNAAEDLGRALRGHCFDHPYIDSVIAATERNPATLQCFEDAWECAGKYFIVEDFTIPGFHEQRGLYHVLAQSIRIYRLGG